METLLKRTNLPTPTSSYPETGFISLRDEGAFSSIEAEAQLPSFFLQPLRSFRPFKLLLVGIFFLVLVSACSAGTILGYSEAAWLDALGSGQSLPFPAGARLSELTRLGPGTLLFMAMQAEDRQDQDTARKLLSAAVEHETGLYARLAAERYLRLLKSQLDGPGLLAFASSDGSKNLAPWVKAMMEAEALSLTGRYAQALSSWTGLLADFPEEAASNETTIRSGIVLAGLKHGTPDSTSIAVAEFRTLLGQPGNEAWYQAMAGIIATFQDQPESKAVLNNHEMQLAQARVLSGTKDYGASVLAFRRYRALTKVNPAPESGATPAEPADMDTPGRLSAEDGAQLASGLDRATLSDMAKAFLFSSRSEGEAIFALLAAQSSKAAEAFQASNITLARVEGISPQTIYLHLFWAGRFARANESWRAAAALFSAATKWATDAVDLDAALWYEAETRSKYSSTEAVAVLARAYASTSNPAYYSDLLEPLSRKAIADRSGSILAAIIAAAAPGWSTRSGITATTNTIPGKTSSDITLLGATPRERARLDYLGARAARTGLLSASQLRNAVPEIQDGELDAYAAAALERAYRQDADPWYRLLAAYHLGLPLIEPADGPGSPEPPPGPLTSSTTQESAAQESATQETITVDTTGQTTGAAADPTTPRIKPETPGEADSFAKGMIRFGLAGKVRTELGEAYRGLEPSTIRAVADSLAKAGDYGSAIRAIAPLFARTGYLPSRGDRELYWPRAFPDETKAAAERFGLPESLLSGLVRSESLFQPSVVSSAGAVGLAQLMPATAAETAGRLKMAKYDITNPADNLTLGASYFKRILDNQNGRFMPAIFSYNAGPTRFRRWENQYGPLPQDLLLEVLDYGETRQYGRNVVAAAMAYAALYYEEDLHGFMALLLGDF